MRNFRYPFQTVIQHYVCREWNIAKSVKQECQIFDSHQNACSIKDVCMIRWLKTKATTGTEVFWTIIICLGTSCGIGCCFDHHELCKYLGWFFGNCHNVQKIVLKWMISQPRILRNLVFMKILFWIFDTQFEKYELVWILTHYDEKYLKAIWRHGKWELHPKTFTPRVGWNKYFLFYSYHRLGL